MAGTVNKVILVGNLGRDPEVRSFQDGNKIATLSVATSETWNDRQSGERREKTEWHRVVIRDSNLVGVAERFLRKGSKVYLEGQIQTRKFNDQSGQERYTTEVLVPRFRGELHILDGRGGGGAEGGGAGGGSPQGGGYRSGGHGGGVGGMDPRQPSPGPGGGDDMDDDIPF